MGECERQTLQPGGQAGTVSSVGLLACWLRGLGRAVGTHRLPATSSTCNSAVWASSGGRTARRLSRKERTLSAVHPPISGGSISRRFRSTLRLVSLASLPRERGRACTEEGGREGQSQRALAEGMGGEGGSPSGNPAPLYRSLLPISWAGCPGKCPTPKRMLPTLALHAPLSPEAPVPTLNRPPGLGHHPPSAGSL